MALTALDAPVSPFPFPNDADGDDRGADDALSDLLLESAPDVAEYATDAAPEKPKEGKRLRSKPSKYTETASPIDKRFSRFRKADRPMLMEQWKLNQSTRKIVVQNARDLRATALKLQCPLLVAKAKERGEYDPRCLRSLLRTQIKCAARADDGFLYDKNALIAYIQANMEAQLLSPVTRKPMSALVLFRERQKAKPDEWKTSKWMPMFAPLALSDAEAGEGEE